MGVAEVARLPGVRPRKSGDSRYTHPPSALAEIRFVTTAPGTVLWPINGTNRGEVIIVLGSPRGLQQLFRYDNVGSLVGGPDRDSFDLLPGGSLTVGIIGGGDPGLDFLRGFGPPEATYDWL